MRRLLLALAVALAACRSRPSHAIPPYGNMEAAYARLSAMGEGEVAREDEALFRCELATAAICCGDEAGAWRALHAASRVMGTLESSSQENLKAILGSEATKTWKGDPYERCMGALYKGLLYWRRGDLDNASACFKNGLFADGYSEIGEHQTDFAVLSFLLGWVSALRGKHEQARFSFEEARANMPGNPWFEDPRPGECNILAVIDIGRGPKKFATGGGDALVRFAAYPRAEAGVEILVDGVSRGRSERGVDLYQQATTRGKKVIDGIRKGKAVFKGGSFIAGVILIDEGIRRDKGGMIAVGAGLLLLSALTNATADTRHWTMLPGEVHVLPLAIAQGSHQVEVRVLDPAGQPIPGWCRAFPVNVGPARDSLYYFRPIPGYGIHALLEPQGDSQ